MSKKHLGWVLAAVSGATVMAASVLAPASDTQAQRGGLSIGGNQAHFGVHSLVGGFVPDPKTVSVVSGGSISASSAAGSNCRGYVSGQPDVILHYNNAASFLRFFVRGEGDTTLVINDAQGRWHCDDDSGGGLNPMVDLNNPPSGQYDIWVGSYSSGQSIRGTLGITELRSQRP